MIPEIIHEFIKAKRRHEGETWTQPSGRRVTKKNGKIVPVKHGRTKKNSIEAIIETDAFKKWFGDWRNNPASASKVVNKSGKPSKTFPLIVWHGSNSDEKFSSFSKKKQAGGFHGNGFYFTENRDYAEGFNLSGKEFGLRSFFLNIRNPFDANWTRDELLRNISGNYKKFVSDIADYVDSERNSPDMKDAITYLGYAYAVLGFVGMISIKRHGKSIKPALDHKGRELGFDFTVGKYAANTAKTMGFDGIKHTAPVAKNLSINFTAPSWMVFDPRQIKSTTAKKFDPTSSNFMKSSAEQ